MNLVYKMQPTRQQILGGGASDPTSELNVNAAMCANGLLRIQDILRPRDAMMAAAESAAAASLGLHHSQHHHGLHPHHLSQLHHGLTSFGGLNMKAGSISPPIGADQSPPATPPLTSLHSPDSLKGSPDRLHQHHGSNAKGGRDKDDLNSPSKKFSDKGMILNKIFKESLLILHLFITLMESRLD